ncbi:MAG TPA: tetratricopeptide repeat protein [Candidatus Cloacimonadota bacterium]|nr:tetratricopeptide repeat protein [Candidatus Cloacimonadota bacterium]
MNSGKIKSMHNKKIVKKISTIHRSRFAKRLRGNLVTISSLLVIVLFFTSCAYYNTFYNAKKYFESAQKKPLTNRNKPSANAIEEYNKVIKKCGVILTEYKESKWADDALFLLAKALYYRGNNELQALEKANDLIKFYPDSPFVPEAHILIARINYTLYKKEDAFKKLQDFIQQAEFKEHHPKALVLLADYYIQEGNYIDAQMYLRTLTEKYANSKEYSDAFFLLGKTLFDNEDYASSLNAFKELSKKKIDKELKLSTNYYIALNQFHLKLYPEASKTVKKLSKDEFRENEIPKLNILNARILIENGNIDEGKSELEDVIKKNPRTLYSAEAVYFIAETNFSKLHLYESAITYYNRVKTESISSPYVQKAVIRSAIASQIIQLQKPISGLPLDDLINEQLKLAEYFLYELDQPDSALAIYQKIPNQKEQVIAMRDSYEQKNLFLESNADLALDSLLVSYNETFSDSIKWNESIMDSLRIAYQNTLPDSLNWLKIVNDSLNFTYKNAFKDSTSWIMALNDSVTVQYKKNLFDDISTRLDRYNNDIVQYDVQYIPFMAFVQAVIYDYVKKDQDKVFELLEFLNSNYPEHKYTIALQKYLNNEEVDFLTKEERENKQNYDMAMNMIKDNTLESLTILEDIADDEDNELYVKANFTLGLTFYIDLQDSTNAKPYFNKVLLTSPQSDYAQFVNKIYNGTSFIIIDVLPAVLDIQKYEKSQPDSLFESAVLDSLDVTKDSLFTSETLEDEAGETTEIKPKKQDAEEQEDLLLDNNIDIIKPKDEDEIVNER